MKKTHFLLFKGKKILQMPITLYLYGKQLKEETVTKFLGIQIDNKLNWISHLTHVRSKISKIIGIIASSKRLLNKLSIKILYNGLIHPYLQYGILAWGNCRPSYKKSLINCQKRIMRVMNDVQARDHTNMLFKTK